MSGIMKKEVGCVSIFDRRRELEARRRGDAVFMKLPESMLRKPGPEPAMGAGAKPTKEALNRRLIDAVETGDLEGVKKALGQGADANARGGMMRRTAWMIADEKGYEEIADELKRCGADTNADSIGQTIPNDTVGQLCIRSILPTPAPAARTAQAQPLRAPAPVPEAQACGESDGTELPDIYRFAWLRRTLGALKHEMTSYKP